MSSFLAAAIASASNAAACSQCASEAGGSSPTRQIEQAEKWLHAQPRDAQLLLTLAQLCSVQQLWGKAQSYLEASLAIAASAEGHIRMAELKTQSGQPGEACRHYQKALALCRAE